MTIEKPVTAAQVFAAVEEFDAMAYFQTVSAPARKRITQTLLTLVNSPCATHPQGLGEGRQCECERPILRNSYGDKIEVPPSERLRLFVDGFLRVPGGWPGIAEMEALYAGLFPAGDGLDRGCPQTPGYGWNDHSSGTHTSMLPPSPEPDALALPPGEEPMSEEERRELMAPLLKRLGVSDSVKHSNDGASA